MQIDEKRYLKIIHEYGVEKKTPIWWCSTNDLWNLRLSYLNQL